MTVEQAERAAYAREAGAAKRAHRNERDALVCEALEHARQRLPGANAIEFHAWRDGEPVLMVQLKTGEPWSVYLYRQDYDSGYNDGS